MLLLWRNFKIRPQDGFILSRKNHYTSCLDMVRFRSENRSMDYMTVSAAKPKLGRLLDRVLKEGKPVVIRRGNRFVQLSEYVVPMPTPIIPQRPVSYFAVIQTPAEYGRANRLARLSPDKPE